MAAPPAENTGKRSYCFFHKMSPRQNLSPISETRNYRLAGYECTYDYALMREQ